MYGMTEPWLPCKDRHVAEVWARTDRGCYLGGRLLARQAPLGELGGPDEESLAGFCPLDQPDDTLHVGSER